MIIICECCWRLLQYLWYYKLYKIKIKIWVGMILEWISEIQWWKFYPWDIHNYDGWYVWMNLFVKFTSCSFIPKCAYLHLFWVWKWVRKRILGPRSLPVEIWFDGSGRLPRQIHGPGVALMGPGLQSSGCVSLGQTCIIIIWHCIASFTFHDIHFFSSLNDLIVMIIWNTIWYLWYHLTCLWLH